MKDLLYIEQLDRNEISEVLDLAESYVVAPGMPVKKFDKLNGVTVANLFYEPSTRTRSSFYLAAKRLGADVLDIDLDLSSHRKGETMLDTARTLQEMNVSVFVLRTDLIGAPAVVALKTYKHVSVINAGEGTVSHPTQGLLDLLTIRQYKKSFEGLKVAIVGDIMHSRVARSAIAGLQRMGVDNICLVAPAEFTIKDTECQTTNDLTVGLQDADVVMVLRVQQERIDKDYDLRQYSKQFCVTEQLMRLAKNDAILMHPGPVNRDRELAASLAEFNSSVINKQVGNGVAVRMAILDLVAGK